MNDSIADLTEIIRHFCEQRDWDQFHGPKDLAIGAVTEAAELLEHFRFVEDQEALAMLADDQRKENIALELADIFFFLLRFSQRFDIDLGAALVRKMAINEARYPVEQVRGRNTKYTKLNNSPATP